MFWYVNSGGTFCGPVWAVCRKPFRNTLFASGRKASKFFMGATARLKEVLFASGRKAGKFFMGATARLKEVIRKWIDKGRVSFALFRSERDKIKNKNKKERKRERERKRKK